MPIAILEIPRSSQTDFTQAKELCGKAGDRLHEELKVPDPEDKESRIVRKDLERAVLKIAFTIGPNEYPAYKGQEAFSPTKEQIELAGQSVLEAIKGLRIDVSQVVIEAWRDTTFVLREAEVPEPVSPVSEQTLRGIGSRLDNPRIKLVLSPLKREGVSSTKELGLSSENEGYQELASELSNRMKEILGLEVGAEVEFADSADTDVSVEFDCETESDNSIPEEVRQYMAESVLHILDSSQFVKEGSAEVWIRQGHPERLVIEE